MVDVYNTQALKPLSYEPNTATNGVVKVICNTNIPTDLNAHWHKKSL